MIIQVTNDFNQSLTNFSRRNGFFHITNCLYIQSRLHLVNSQLIRDIFFTCLIDTSYI